MVHIRLEKWNHFLTYQQRKIFLYSEMENTPIRLYVLGRSDLDDSLKQCFVKKKKKKQCFVDLPLKTRSWLQNSLNGCFFLVGGKRRIFITKLFISIFSWQQLPSDIIGTRLRIQTIPSPADTDMSRGEQGGEKKAADDIFVLLCSFTCSFIDVRFSVSYLVTSWDLHMQNIIF